MATPEELARYIRFQLAELSAKNAHHEFEHIARHFSRLRLCERIVPSTGPVSAGGDGGKDFETYRTYLSSTPIAGSTFLAFAQGRSIVFACTLNKSIEGKIRSDVKTICANGGSIDDVYYFCEVNLAVAKKHKLQKFCRETYGIELTVFDGEALAEQLTSPDVFWIAQQYLAVPAEMFPRIVNGGDYYQKVRRVWLEEKQTPSSPADFFEIKSGLRRATFKTACRPDLLGWLEVMDSVRTGPVKGLQRRASYEICVAALRGLNDLDSRKALVVEYLSSTPDPSEIAELRDYSLLLSYCSSAVVYGHFQFDSADLYSYTKGLVRILDSRLEAKPSIGQRCELLEIRGTVESLWFRESSEAKLDPNGMFGFWKKMLRLVPNVPLFPLEQFADVLTAIAPAFAGNSNLDDLTRRTTALLEKRGGGRVAAEKCRDRAAAHLKNQQRLQAVRELHTAKIKWFSAETLRGSVLSMLILAESYEKLGLLYAAKQYSAAAVYFCMRHPDDDIKDLIPPAMSIYFDSSYEAGEWLTCVGLSSLVFASLSSFIGKSEGDSHSEIVDRIAYHLTMIRVVAKRHDPDLSISIEKIFDSWSMSEESKEYFQDMLKIAREALSPLSGESQKVDMQRELWGAPFMDLGSDREVVWRALGIQWEVLVVNARDHVAMAEEFVATLQILLADLAAVDLVLLPTVVQLEVYLTPQDKIQCERSPSNERAVWRIGLPEVWRSEGLEFSDISTQILSVAISVLSDCSVLPAVKFKAKIAGALELGLIDKVFVVRRYCLIFREFVSDEEFARSVREKSFPLFPSREFSRPEDPELAWNSGDGPGYSVKAAAEQIKNRYVRCRAIVKHTLPRLLSSPDVTAYLQGLRALGRKDWEILLLIANRAISYRVNARGLRSSAEIAKASNELANQEEEGGWPDIPATEFNDKYLKMQGMAMLAAIAKTWGLEVRGQTPDVSALRRLLEARYHILRDDVQHEDIFSN